MTAPYPHQSDDALEALVQQIVDGQITDLAHAHQLMREFRRRCHRRDDLRVHAADRLAYGSHSATPSASPG